MKNAKSAQKSKSKPKTEVLCEISYLKIKIH